MLRTLFRAFSSQPNQKAVPALDAAKTVDASLLKLVAGGAPKGGWMRPEQMSTQAPKGGWH